MLRHWLITFLHPFFHKAGVMEACWLCAMVWRRAMSDPGFVKAMEEGLADIEAGRTVKWSDIRHKY